MNGFKTIKWNWDKHPERNDEWFNDMERILGSEVVQNELIVK